MYPQWDYWVYFSPKNTVHMPKFFIKHMTTNLWEPQQEGHSQEELLSLWPHEPFLG